MTEHASGHQAVAHTADVRLEAWAPTRERCIGEAVLGAVEAFLDTSSPPPAATRECRLTGDTDDELLVAALEEMIYRLDTSGEVPVDVQFTPTPGGLDARFAMVDAERVPQVGAVPKAVSLHELSFAARPEGWWCTVTLDV